MLFVHIFTNVLSDHHAHDLPQSVLAMFTTILEEGIVKSSSTGEKGIGTSIAPIRFTGVSKW